MNELKKLIKQAHQQLEAEQEATRLRFEEAKAELLKVHPLYQAGCLEQAIEAIRRAADLEFDLTGDCEGCGDIETELAESSGYQQEISKLTDTCVPIKDAGFHAQLWALLCTGESARAAGCYYAAALDAVFVPQADREGFFAIYEVHGSMSETVERLRNAGFDEPGIRIAIERIRS
jgi:tetratricopeptide (TPR) repeat protein